jgi:hypothetical protein
MGRGLSVSIPRHTGAPSLDHRLTDGAPGAIRLRPVRPEIPMTRHLSALFRRLFPLVAAGFALAVLGLAVAVWAQGAGVVQALGVALFGLAALVAAFGLVAVQIENNALLRRIALALEAGPADDEGDTEVPDVGPSPAARPSAPVIPLGTRAEPPLRAAPRPMGRTEPPLSRHG